MKKLLFKILIIIILLIAVFVLPLFYPTGPAIYFRLFLLSLILAGSVIVFKNIFVNSGMNKIISNTAVVLFSVFVCFIILESAFMFIPRSANFGCTLACKLWFAKYWKPENSFGFRDHEPEKSKPAIIFAGDSLTAGHGLKSVEDRFSNIVGKELRKKGDKYAVINLSKIALDTRSEYETMVNFISQTGIKPEKIILQYYGNDIEHENGIHFLYDTQSVVNTPFRPLIAGSYLFNYLYWSSPRYYLADTYREFLYRAYQDDVVFSKHKENLGLFVHYADKNSVQLIVVIFPFLTDLEASDSIYVNRIVNYFKENNVDIINVSQLIRDIPVSERIVNNNDLHPSKKVNAMVAREIMKRIE